MCREDGFSLLEMTMAVALMLVVTGGVFSVLNPAEGSFSTEPEVADMQQRLRVASDTLARDLIMAGAGAYLGGQTGALNDHFAPVLPFRQGAIGNAAIGAHTTDTITVFYVPSTAAQTTLSQPLASSSGTLQVNAETACPRNADGSAQALCGFTADMTLLVFDDTGNYDAFTVNANGSDETGARLTVNRPPGAANTVYPGGPPGADPPPAKVVQVVERTYHLKTDHARKAYQLMQYDGSAAADVPVVDNVVGLAFEYYGDSQPPTLRRPLSHATGPWTSYGPKPPPPGVTTTAYPAGENCLFTLNEDGVHVPRLLVLGDGSNPNALVALRPPELSDGPWCPDATSGNRYDADLLRIRRIGVTVRVQAAIEAMRGPASVLFANAGTSRSGTRWVPDQQVRIQVSPRNLNLAR
jgi:hypothetical protein